MRNFFIAFSFLITASSGWAKTLSDTPQVSIYPNPTERFIYISVKDSIEEIIHIDIFDIQGKIRFSDSFVSDPAGNPYRIDLYNLAGGLYFVKTGSNNWNRVQKIVLMNSGGTDDPIDILHTDLSLSIRNLSQKTISGTAIITFVAKSDLDSIEFDLLKLKVDSVKMDSTDLAFSQNDSVLLIDFGSGITKNDTVSIRISYSGQPVTDKTWGGFYFNGNYAYNMGVGFSANPHSFGRVWFPCVDDFRERSTYSFHITTDSGWKAVCNGLKQNENINPDGSTTWNWSLSQPIPAYLASVAVGKYEFVKMSFDGQNGSIPVWIAMEAKDTAKVRSSFARLNDAMQCFEEKFGPYLFDRVGYVGVPFNSGAMEHAGNIGYPIYAVDSSANYETLFAHELAHHWWGNLATCRTAEDMWLNEGWASYCESIFLECVYGRQYLIADIKQKNTETLVDGPKKDKGFYPVSGVPTQITYGTHVYKKGAVMAHTLRTLMGDSAFFAACKNYLTKHRFTDVSSVDLKVAFQPFTTIDLNSFFQNWIYEKGFEAVVPVDYATNATSLQITLMKAIRYKSATLKKEPVEIGIHGSNGIMQLAKVWMDQPVQTYSIDLTPSITDVAFIRINPMQSMGFGFTQDIYTLTTTGGTTLANQLTSINIKDITDSVTLMAEHHWVEAYQGKLRDKGIRISPERYWHFDGVLPATFNASVYFNYNGQTGAYLDEELLQNITTEDSIVLLYRPLHGTEWQIHTDNTFQPGTNKTDKGGRFWVNKLEKGDYAFGIRDHRITGLTQPNEKLNNSFVLYPNPANKQVRIDFERPFSGQLLVIDINGKTIRQVELRNQSQHMFDTDPLKSGMYFIIANNGDGRMIRSFIKE